MSRRRARRDMMRWMRYAGSIRSAGGVSIAVPRGYQRAISRVIEIERRRGLPWERLWMI